MADRSIDRRTLLRRGGIVAAGLTGAGAIGAVGAPQASAADGDAVKLGSASDVNNTATSTTTITGQNSAGATLAVANTTGTGSVVHLTSKDGTVAPLNLTDRPYPSQSADSGINAGDLLSRDGQLYYGQGAGLVGTVLTDMTFPVTVGLPYGPVRIIDTRYTASRANILNPSGNLDAYGRILAGHTIYIELVDPQHSDTFFSPTCVFGNLSSYLPLAQGNATLFPYHDHRPATTTVNYSQGGGQQNSFAIGCGFTPGGTPALSLYSSQTSHMILDMTASTDYYSLAGYSPAGHAAARPHAARPQLRRPTP